LGKKGQTAEENEHEQQAIGHWALNAKERVQEA
jgi:hypothetical protein